MAGLIMEWFGCAQDPKAGVLAVDADLGVLEGWEALELKMQKKGCSDAAIKAFKANYDKLVSGSDTGTIAEEEIDCVTSLPTLEEKRYGGEREAVKPMGSPSPVRRKREYSLLLLSLAQGLFCEGQSDDSSIKDGGY